MKGSRFDAVVTFLTNGVQGSMGLLTGVLSARLLGTAGKGELAAIQAIATMVVTLGTFGLYESVVYYAAREPRTGAEESVSATTGLMLASLVFIPAAWATMPLLLPGQRSGIVWGARVYLLIFPAFLLLGGVQSLLRASGRMVRWNLLRILAQAFWLVVLGIAAYLHVAAAETLAATYAVVLCAVGVIVVLVHRSLWRPGWPPKWSRLPRLFRYGLPLFARTGSRAINVRLDVVVMAALLDPQDVGIYSVAATWSMILGLIPSAVGAVLFPRLSRERDLKRRRVLERKSVAAGMAIIVLAAIALGSATPYILPLLFGDAFGQASSYAVGLLGAGVVLALSQLLQAVVQGRGRTGVLFGAEAAGLVVTIVGLVVLLPRFHLWGAVATSTMAYTTVTATLLVWFAKTRRSSNPDEPADEKA